MQLRAPPVEDGGGGRAPPAEDGGGGRAAPVEDGGGGRAPPVEDGGRVEDGGGGRALPAESALPYRSRRKASPAEAAHPCRSRRQGSTGGGWRRRKDGCPSRLKQEEGLDQRGPEAAAHTGRSRRRGSTGRSQRQLLISAETEGAAHPAGTGGGCPTRLKQEERLDQREPETPARPGRSRISCSTGGGQRRLPNPAKGGGRTRSAGVVGGCLSRPKQKERLDRQELEAAAHPSRSLRKGSTDGSRRRLPNPAKNQGLDQWRVEAAAHPGRSRRKGLTGGGQRRLPIPAEGGGRAKPAGTGKAAHPSRNRRKGSTSRGPEATAHHSQSRRKGSTSGGQRRLPITAKAGGRARPAGARGGCPSQPKQEEGLHQRGPEAAAHPSRSKRKGSTGRGRRRLPIPAEAGGRARLAGAGGGCQSQPKQEEGLERQGPEAAAHPSRSKRKGSTGGGRRAAAIHRQSRGRARPGGRRGRRCHAQADGRKGKGSTGVGRRQLPSQPKQEERFHQLVPNSQSPSTFLGWEG
ncbi:peptide chain release factor 2-like [Macrobrachium nipponense]|uniref:peptide chain release factor 2-like n=1 Tax=Macrobrachium nipponense TaxID=159736 RepID=UPI0030C89790